MATINLRDYKMIDLEHERRVGMSDMPTHNPKFGYEVVHRHSDTDPKVQGVRTSAWGNMSGNEHTGTHVDALCHQSESGVMYGGVKVADAETKAGFTVYGAENLPIFFNRGVLLDVPAVKGVEWLEPKYEVTVEDLQECIEVQGTEITEGSVVLVNTGNGRFWDDPERYLDTPGVGAAASQMLADKKVRAVGADNFAWDEPYHYETEMNCNGPGHVILIVRSGIHIFENLNLQPLVESGHREFIFAASPIKIKGATASPVRPFALVKG